MVVRNYIDFPRLSCVGFSSRKDWLTLALSTTRFSRVEERCSLAIQKSECHARFSLEFSTNRSEHCQSEPHLLLSLYPFETSFLLRIPPNRQILKSLHSNDSNRKDKNTKYTSPKKRLPNVWHEKEETQWLFVDKQSE